jgi:hypothetical protein
MPQGRTRREVLKLLGGAVVPVPLFASGDEFWNTKDPALWSDAEIHRLISDSPWARQVPVRRGPPDPAHDPRPWQEAPPIEPRRPPAIIPHPKVALYTSLVRWESAKPILDALKLPLPETLLNCHVIGVSGSVLRRLMHASANRLDDLKTLATLQPRGRSPASATVIEARTGAPIPTLWFGFPKDAVRMAKSDSAARFSTSFDGWKIEAKFHPRQMLYRGTESL